MNPCSPISRLTALALWLCPGGLAWAGPYSAGLNDPTNAFDAPVPGFIGPDGVGKANVFDGYDDDFNPIYLNPRNYVNPLFFGWAESASNYVRADGEGAYNSPGLALGPVTGDDFDVVSLGDLTAAKITAGNSPGRITLLFEPIRNLPGADFVIFENGFLNSSGSFADLAYVEVSSDGVNFARFPSASLTAAAVNPYGTLNPTNVFNLAGKHVNAFGESWGTPFDLTALATNPLVTAGTLNLNAVRYVRIVDIPGNGSFLDSSARPIYDPWLTTGSGGFDLEAVGVISTMLTFSQWAALMSTSADANADTDFDGATSLMEFVCGMQPGVPDAALLPKAERVGNDMVISFRRDTRTADVTIEVLGAANLQGWQVIARSVNGGALQAVAPFSPVIDDASDSDIASIGVIRRAKVHAPAGVRFLKLQARLSP